MENMESTAKARVENELNELKDKARKLFLFIDSHQSDIELTNRRGYLLQEQLETMIKYINILEERLITWKEL